MKQIIDGWVFGALLVIGIVSSACLILVELQNIRSINDRAHMNREIGQIKASQQWLEGVVKKAIEDDRKRREARSKGQ